MSENVVFISYRRTDIDIACRVYERLVGHFGSDAIFIDLDAIPPGENFSRHIDRVFDDCEVVLAIIGPDWLDKLNQKQKLAEEDYVLTELQLAVERGRQVVPVLVHGATVPRKNDLPEPIQSLAFRNAIEVPSGKGFHDAMTGLVSTLQSSTNLRVMADDCRYECAMFVVGIIACIVSTGLFVQFSGDFLYIVHSSSTRATWLLAGPMAARFFLGLGAFLIVAAQWIFCLRNAAERKRLFQGGTALLAPPKDRLVVFGFGLSVATFGWWIFSGIPSLVLLVLGVARVNRSGGKVGGGLLATWGFLVVCSALLLSSMTLFWEWSLYRAYGRLDSAQQALEDRRLDEAIYLGRQASKRLANHGTAYKIVGQAYLENEKYREALTALTDATRRYLEALEGDHPTVRGRPMLIDSEVRAFNQLLVDTLRSRAEALRQLGDNQMADADEQYANQIGANLDRVILPGSAIRDIQSAPAPPGA